MDTDQHSIILLSHNGLAVELTLGARILTDNGVAQGIGLQSRCVRSQMSVTMFCLRTSQRLETNPPPITPPPEIIIQDIIIQIHKPKPRHEIRDPPDRRAPLRPRDRVARFRVQVQPHRRRRDLELTRPHGRGRRREVQVHVVGGYEEAEHHVGGRDQVAEGLEFDLEGGVGDGVDVRLWW